MNQPLINSELFARGKVAPVVEILTDYLSQCVDYFQTECISISSPLYLAAAGGSASIHANRALMNTGVDAKLIAVAPTFKHNLRYFLGDDRPVKFHRWQKHLLNYLPGILSSSLGRSIYNSKRFLNRMSERHFIEPVHQHSQRSVTKQLALSRPGCPIELHVAQLCSALDPTDSAKSLITELLRVRYDSPKIDSDDEDDLLLFGHQLPSPSPFPFADTPASNLALILPKDCVDRSDRVEISRLSEAARVAGVACFEVPGRLSCHEEFAEATAAVIDSLV
jgi:hypothetical protein